MTPAPSIHALINTVPRVTVAAALARLTLWYGVRVMASVDGRWAIGGCLLTDDELVDRYRLRAARVQQGIG
jgi:hypothetical protein